MLLVAIILFAAGVLLPLTGRLQVLVEVRLEGERLVAAEALIVLVRGVGLHVGPEVAPVGEGLAAVRAAVGLLAGVGAEVTLQEPGPGKHLAADPAGVGEFVREEVHGQRGHAHVGLPAGQTFLGGLGVEAPVGLLVSREVRGGRVLLPALRARVFVAFR